MHPAAVIHWVSVGQLLLISLAIMGSPGPVTVSLVAAGSVLGVRRSLPYLVGLIVGSTVVLVAVATGITAALLALPAIGSILILISAAYILWLAYHIATAPVPSKLSVGTKAFSLVSGAVLGVANPKAWVAIAAVFTSVHLADTATADVAAKLVALTAMIILICSTWLVAGQTIAPLMRDVRGARIINVALAVVLVSATALAVLH